ncbi:hypothetical protein D1227_19230 [Henriciella mobilis]|uniref:hypothetical protein n=1 Tax=Henriciella mobilis TaxID=2305467 RepID=UPI000E664171|nr:hypothetical protein [Henriciella mobilis]RIJ15625.1 hypothetical protein D1231_12880 [Henriciella mobilis]RIJ19089.1 hypothetical protein D1227_19230 [Henriciella mobilis]
MIRFVIVAAAIWLGFAAQAVGQTRDIYTIRDITVEEEADSVIEAQQQAFMSARIEGAYQIIDRLTLPEDRAGKLEPGAITPEVASQLAAAVDVEQETRGGNRYVGKLAVVYNPVNVRDFLKARGIPYIDQPAPKAVVFPVSDRFPASVWAEAWPDQSVGQLAPYAVSRSPLASAFSGWPELEADVQAADARRAIKAVLDGSRGAFRVDLYSVTAAGETRLGSTGSMPTLEAAVDAASGVLDYVWKSQSIIRTQERTPARSTVFFTSLVEWNSLRSAMARSPLVEDFVIEGLSRTGAVVAFVHAGDTNRLISNLRERGIMLDPDPSGWVMTTAVSRGADLGVE